MASKKDESGEGAVRLPVQRRSAERVEKVLDAAERMLAEVGPENTSIPDLAEATAVPRHAIYPFFPDKYALFSHLARRHMEALGKALAASKAAGSRTWRAWVEAMIKSGAAYYNAHPAACELLLRGFFADTDRAAHAAKNDAIGGMLRAKAASLNVLATLPKKPDAAALAIEIVFACFKYGYVNEGRVSPRICEEAARAATSYLAAWE